jgi:outer membrane immunogenic protein
MKSFVVASLAATLASSAALAADLPSYQAVPMVSATPLAYNWTGFYIGAQTGWMWGDSSARFGAPPTRPSLNYKPDGFVLGGFAGFNYQWGAFVAGVEADAEWADASGSASSAALSTAHGSLDMNWDGSIRGRFGAAFNRFLVYATGGAAFADADVRGGPLGGPLGSFSDTNWGWTAGAGIEGAITNNILARVEYRYSDYGTFSGPVANGQRESVDLTTSVIRAGIAYKF